uniref:Putative secreted protein n=1 Tax=Anopheles darlingi TaxID=43151 RepID=A0A2M4DDG9_ANODA
MISLSEWCVNRDWWHFLFLATLFGLFRQVVGGQAESTGREAAPTFIVQRSKAKTRSVTRQSQYAIPFGAKFMPATPLIAL